MAFIRRVKNNKSKGRELKISAIHQGWEMIGDRASLLHKNHFIHKEKLPSWEEFEYFLMDSFEYDPTYHQLVINDDGANGFLVELNSSEGTISVFSKRLKNGRSWSKNGITKLTYVMIALIDGKTIKTLQGSFKSESEDTKHNNPLSISLKNSQRKL